MANGWIGERGSWLGRMADVEMGIERKRHLAELFAVWYAAGSEECVRYVQSSHSVRMYYMRCAR